MSRSVSILPPPSDRPFLTVEEAAAVLCIRRTLPTALPVSSSRPAPGCLVSASGVDGSSSHAPPWSAGRTLTLRTRTTQREASNRSACRRHRSRVHRRDPWCCPARMGGPHPPLRITERSQQIRAGINAHACHRVRPQQGHLRSSPSDSSLRRPHRGRHQSYRVRPLRHDPLPTARSAQAHTYTDEPSSQRRASPASRTLDASPATHRTHRAADAARLRLTDMPAHSRRQQPNKPMELQ